MELSTLLCSELLGGILSWGEIWFFLFCALSWWVGSLSLGRDLVLSAPVL